MSAHTVSISIASERTTIHGEGADKSIDTDGKWRQKAEALRASEKIVYSFSAMDCIKNISMNVKMCAMRSDRPGSSKRSIAANNCYLLANCRDHGCSTSLCSGMRSCAYVYTFGSKNMYYNNPRVRFNATQGHQRASHILMDNSTEFGVERRSISIDSTPHRSSSCPCSSSTTSFRRLDLLRTHSSVNGVALESTTLHLCLHEQLQMYRSQRKNWK